MSTGHSIVPSRSPKRRRQTVRAILTSIFLIVASAVLVWNVYPALVNLLTPEVERLRKEGDQLLADGRLAEAVLTFRQAVEVDPKNPAALNSLADAYSRQGRLRMAARYKSQLFNLQSGKPATGPLDGVPDDLSGLLELAWVVSLNETPPTGGIAQNGLLFSAFEEGLVAAQRIESGEAIWKMGIGTPITSAPASDGEFVWVGAADGSLKALDAANGSIRWSFKTGGPIYAAPAYDAKRVYCPSSDSSLYAISKTDGSLVWKFTTAGGLHGTPELGAGVLFFGSLDGKIYAVEAATGAPIWKDGILTSGPVESQPLYNQGRVVVGSGDGRVYSLDAASGGQYWRASTPDAVYARPLALENTMYIASSGQILLAYDFETGNKLWEASYPVPLRNPPFAWGNLLFLVGDGDPNLSVYDRTTGNQVAQLSTGDWVSAGPWIHNDMLLLLGRDGSGMAFRLAE